MPPPTGARATGPAAANGLPEPARLGAAAPASTRATSASALNVPSASASNRTHTPRAPAASKPNPSPTTAATSSSASRSPHTSATHLATPSRRKSSTSIAKSAQSLSTGPAPASPAPAPVAAPAAAVTTTTTPGDPPAIDPLAAISGNLRIAWAADTGGAHVHCCAISPAGDLVALGLATGAVTTFHVSTGKQVRKLTRTDAELAVPCTAVAWRPDTSGTLAAAFPDGRVTFWHATSGTSAGAGIDEGDNQIFAAEYAPSTSSTTSAAHGIRLATAGSDGTVRIYSEPSDAPRTLTHELAHGARDAHAAGHSNRVFCVRWHPRDANTLASGGWDSTVQIWDLTSGAA
ncbi:hypothetical protein AMAG_08864 [Allomyces macrogynus ATCC 38327]|uniref:Uncharacterized protein n=1 Tax=Allomyces macrogynus (strain ATCC 38327) TaxID=578462 RepID=A0A0L0SMJ9_ALLM3|nr:hypothetical protein AMAG_08864 [Allomyces macrogynus ATCC 38327]|eukprot:KNE63786.1 hypothetical protein AMAG_08864 [Allomyces macrogynus ATCC 38327]